MDTIWEAFFAGALAAISLAMFAGAVYTVLGVRSPGDVEPGHDPERAPEASNVVRWPIRADYFRFKNGPLIPSRRRRS